MLTLLEFVSWPSGDSKPIADLLLSDNELLRRTGLPLLAVEDDLGPAVAAGADLERDCRVLFFRYLQGPNQRIGVYIDSKSDPVSAWQVVRRHLSLADHEVAWTSFGGATDITAVNMDQ